MARKKKNKPAKNSQAGQNSPSVSKGNSSGQSHAKPSSNRQPLALVAGVGVVVAILIAVVLGRRRTSGENVVSSTFSAHSPEPIAFTSPTTKDLLTHFSPTHNERLMWGTFRPGILFGVKSRTHPESVVAGIMWSTATSDGKEIMESKLRHTCEESDTREGLRFGYSEHDGASYGKQVIEDPANNLKMDTIFLRKSETSWLMRVIGSVLPSESRKPKIGGKVFFFYLGIDNEFVPDAKLSGAGLQIQYNAEDGKPSVIHGRTKQLGNFRLVAAPSAGSVQAVGVHDIVSWAMPNNTAVVDIKSALLQHLKGPTEKGKEARAQLLQAPSKPSSTTSSVVVLQMLVHKSFELDFLFEVGTPEDAPTHLTEATTSETWTKEKGSLSAQISGASDHFKKEFEKRFQIKNGGKYTAEHIEFAQAATSAMLGGVGYFYGKSTVKHGEKDMLLPPRPLFTAVPSRSFFPRGFLWDEGFHQLLIGRWDPELAQDAISHWFSLMHADGWIPREQILGAEAVAKVPAWAVAQHRTHANPPTLLLAIESLLQQAPSTDDRTIRWLSTLFPALEQWFSWFQTSQSGEEPGTFRWRGRDPNDGKLNAMTLSSGLDDYPRASKVTKHERHVDLHSWIAHGAGVLARVGERIGLAKAKVSELQNLHDELVSSLDSLHWDDKRKRYCDYGVHANQGSYLAHVVVKCGTEDGSNSVEHTLTPQHFQQLQQGASKVPACPASHPKFMFPLGDGQGNLMTREVFVPKNEKKQFVDHTGYVSLFPFFLRLIPADSPKLEFVLKTLSDDKQGLWSNYGLRSLAPKDRMFLRENAPGDAPYWRGPIWINCNFLAVYALRHYSAVEGPHRELAAKLLDKLKRILVTNIFKNYNRTGFLWEQYNPSDGKGQRTHPFNGWSSLVVLIMT